jgi:hypothetical protein
MAQIEILEELKKLTTTERLAIIEATLRLIREDLQRAERPGAWTGLKQRLTSAAEALLCRTMLQVAN